MSFNIFKDHNSDGYIKYDDTKISVSNLKSILGSNLIFDKNDIEWYTKYNRFGYIDPYNTYSANREFLFFTKPDLNLFDGGSNEDISNINFNALTLHPDLANIPIFIDAINNHKNSLTQLCLSAKCEDDRTCPFMYLLSNSVTSKLDLPGITADTKESTSNIYGTNIQYRGHSLKSDLGYDFTLSFTDTAYLEIYHMVKIYDEYMRLIKLGETAPKHKYITNMILPDQFSIYKFIIGDDGETIKYYCKFTGVFFTDVPRSDFGDPPQDGFKYSLSFHAQFVEDNNPMILQEFNRISGNPDDKYLKPYDYEHGRVDNTWVRVPKVFKYYANTDKKAAREQVNYQYRLKWTL